MTSGDLFKLKSCLKLLQELDLNQLIEVQYDATKEIQRRILQLQARLKEHEVVCSSEGRLISEKNMNFKVFESPLNNGKHESIGSEHFEMHVQDLPQIQGKGNEERFVAQNLKCLLQNNHNEDLASTQFEPTRYKSHKTDRSTRSSSFSQPDSLEEPLIPGTLDIHTKDIDLSSPLKVSNYLQEDLVKQSLGKENAQETGVQQHENSQKRLKREYTTISDSEGEFDWSYQECSKKSRQNEENKKDKGNEVNKVNFNLNPITGKPWIFEDFKANEDVIGIRKGRKRCENAKLAKFYAVAGRPKNEEKLTINNSGFLHMADGLDKDEAMENIHDSYSCEFENLRHRSKSPPGYGRMDFPNTQENLEDRKKSQEIMFAKTKDRFYLATKSAVPLEKREYYFRNNELNEIINSGNFTWDEKGLQIFKRK